MLYTEKFPIRFKPIASSKAILQAGNARFSLLSDRLVRLEFHPDSKFEDRPSQVIWYREQPVPEFESRRYAGNLEIETQDLILHYTPNPTGFTPTSLSIHLKADDIRWNYGDEDSTNLLGTCRTLDMAHGELKLEPGLISRKGWSLLDDNLSLVFSRDGWLETRPQGGKDLYFFGYGYDYTACLRDYFKITGRVPLIPRWALGNWWSRYWAYTADELLALMDEFKEKNVPLAVCVVDMDWHITETGNQASGWTGYTWNEDLFPDPPTFLKNLHKRGLKTALNLHPAEGIYPHERQFFHMAKRLGIDLRSNDPIPFNISDPDFTAAYFELLHHPHEQAGVDFWWIDWQQGTTCNLYGLDPLWWLNHLHYYDSGRDQDKRCFIFSRWGGLGNHRYPIGFSGDTIVSWESLAYQPYFTSTAANVGYGWWSHDIGGHMGGIEDPELFTRWVQYGVFSPILRLHSTKTRYHERLPWAYDPQTEQLTRSAMQLRHALISYLYTMAWRYQEHGNAPIRPMYHDHPPDERAYNCQDQYYFGSELLVAPYITPMDPQTRLSRQVIWLPEGDWFHFFSGEYYHGDRWYALYGSLEEIPVFAKAGAIIPLSHTTGWGDPSNPEILDVHIYPGENNRFELYEDNGLDRYSLTTMVSEWSESLWRFRVLAVTGTKNHLPINRCIRLHVHNLKTGFDISVYKNGQKLECGTTHQPDRKTITLQVIPHAIEDELTIEIQPVLDQGQSQIDAITKMIHAFRMNTWDKDYITQHLDDIIKYPAILGSFGSTLSDSQFRALFESISGSGSHLFHDYRTKHQKLILWNNQEIPDIHLHWSARHYWQTSSGTMPIPNFGVFTFADEWIAFQRGSTLDEDPIPADQRIHANLWWVDIHYGLRTITYKR